MAIVYTNVSELGFQVTETADAIREDIVSIERHNDLEWYEADEKTGKPREQINWIELTAVRARKENEVDVNGDGTIHVPIHIRLSSIVAVGD